MHRSSRYRLYPNQTQERQFARLCGVDRNLDNLAVGWCGGREMMKVPYARIEKYGARARHYQWRASRRKRIGLKDADGNLVRTKSGRAVRVASMRCRRLLQRAAKAKRKGECFRCLACGHTDHAGFNAARNILNLGLEKLSAGGAPVTGRGGDDEAEAFFMECLVDTASDPSTMMQWNYRGSPPDFHSKS